MKTKHVVNNGTHSTFKYTQTITTALTIKHFQTADLCPTCLTLARNPADISTNSVD